MLAHFDANGVGVAGAIEIGMLAAFVGRDVLDDGIVLYREMPAEVADYAATQGAAFQGFGRGAYASPVGFWVL